MARGRDRWPIERAASAEFGRAALLRLRRLARGPRFRRTPGRLLFAPQDLRSADPAVADDMAAGLYTFGDRTLSLGRNSPFSVVSPSPAWAHDLYSFGWLRHLRAADTPEAQGIARAIVADMAERRGRELDEATMEAPAVTARRVTSVLAHSHLLLAGAEYPLYRSCLRLIGRDASSLDDSLREAPVPTDRLAAALGLCFAGLCCEGLDRPFRRANRALATELDAQILADGGHVGRNPGTLVDLLLDLLPLRLLYESRAVQMPAAIDRSIDRIMPMLRFLRHGSGDLALFNGMGSTPLADMAAVLAHDTVRGTPVRRAEPSGYDRLEAGGTLALVDTGAVPSMAASGRAHLGCLSFELSSGPNRIVVNCGSPPHPGPLMEAARYTPAHSTLTFDEASSGSILDAPHGRGPTYLFSRFGPVVLDGPRDVEAVRTVAGDGAVLLTAHHDGYRRGFGAIHTRRFELAAGGDSLMGTDIVAFPQGAAGNPAVCLRFHLHPTVRAAPAEGSADIVLDLPGGERWRFACEGIAPRLEPGAFLAVTEGRRPTSQIVVERAPTQDGPGPEIRWMFWREAAGAST